MEAMMVAMDHALTDLRRLQAESGRARLLS
ncbi:hypothetical protein PFL603g_03500 [Pseudomonas fluorescens]|uniref:Uncharacterized protein n=1 Tax=Pseudomonas fluorescens TaxID=294 RepID=A0A109KQ56_PSEFL|nr:hypothetical protein PFL603g_03500 [Pseudomonas fluorescens]